MARLAAAIGNHMGPPPAQQSIANPDTFDFIRSDADLKDGQAADVVSYVVDRYLSNMRMARSLCREYAVTPLFIWEPQPWYKYDANLQKDYVMFPGGVPRYAHDVYAKMESYQAPDFLSLAAMMEHADKRAYVDDSHYNERTNEQIAEELAGRIAKATRAR